MGQGSWALTTPLPVLGLPLATRRSPLCSAQSVLSSEAQCGGEGQAGGHVAM